ncbi:26S proteasome regulatory subunit 7 [Striga asiatica]|uniref:26S proteasome regulatory subunit 7 n=1 Tax=Striga asiatica TaxID=4170 RepID=A0A5A7PIT2_STRAF|nr:26S proteasome regulatory subunit 7 [Striga asiatica]
MYAPMRAVTFEEDGRDPNIWFLNHNYHESMEHVVGWYSTGPKLKENDLNIHELFNGGGFIFFLYKENDPKLIWLRSTWRSWPNSRPKYYHALSSELPMFVRLFHYYSGKERKNETR